MKAVAIKLEDAERERLTSLATAKKRTSHFLMREAIREYLEREEARLAFITAAETSFEHYKETGLHVTLSEFSSWADTLVSGSDEPAPKCHT